MHLKMQFGNKLQIRHDLFPELLLRLVVIIVFKISDDAVPLRRIIQPEEAWQYNFPHTDDIVPVNTLHVFDLVSSLVVIWAIYKYNNIILDAITACLGVSLSYFLSMTITNFIKLTAGRPRPDFFARCYTNPPKDAYNLSLAACDRPEEMVIEGYKSFPSGHSTMVFGCMAYLSLYIAYSLRLFQPVLYFPGLRLLAFLAPLVCATLIAMSRTIDYHHHWQDVFVGSLIGTVVAYMCFCQGFSNLLEKKWKTYHPLSPQPPQPELPFMDVDSKPKSTATCVGVQSY